jgi:dipeptidyl aminopeptidase/acylaminoacyl peptidase
MSLARWIGFAAALWGAHASADLTAGSDATSATELKSFDVERSWALSRIGNPAIAPDGNTVVAPVSRVVMSEDKSYSDLWLWRLDGSVERAFTAHISAESAPTFSPDGKQLAFVAQRDEDKAAQLYVMAVDGGEARRLTSVATGVQSPKWFADGKRIAFVSRVFVDLPLAEQGKRMDERANSKMTGRVWDAGPVSAWDQLLDERQFHVFAVDLAGAAPEALTQGTGLELPRSAVQGTDATFALAPDGNELAFVADSDARRESQNLDVFTLPLNMPAEQRKAMNRTLGNEAGDASPQYSPNGRYLSFVQQRIKGFYADKGRLMLLDRRDSAPARELFSDWDRTVDGLIWAPDSQRLYGAIDDAGTVRAYELPLSGKPRALTGETSFSALAISRSGTLVALRQSFIEPPTLVRLNTKSGAAQKLSTINDTLLAQSALGSYESVSYPGANGKSIQMWVNYPPNFDRSKKYPLFMVIHGGPHNAVTNGMQFRWNAQVFGSWGYISVQPNFHGSSGFGQAFTDSINPEWAEQPYQDVIKAAQFMAKQPYIDSDRMVAGGGSYGGYLTTILLGREHPFKALVAHAAVYNLYTQTGADFAVERPRFGGFWENDNRAVIERNSPHLAAANFKTPTLVVHGQTDLRVPVNHGMELYQTLLSKGVPSRLLYYPNENHWVLKPQNSVFWYQQVQRWFEEQNPKN